MKQQPFAVRIYAFMLRLYPHAFRQAYGAEILQVFRDSYRDLHASGSRMGISIFWLMMLVDLIQNAWAERWQQMIQRRWVLDSMHTLGGLIAWVGTGLFWGWVVIAITVFLLIPWDLGYPPPGTFAESVNNFFERGRQGQIFWPSMIILACEIIAFLRHLINRTYTLTGLYWRFTALNSIAIMLGIGLALAGMGVSSLIFPNMDPWEGDQSYGVALVYWGLILMVGFTVYFVRLAWVVPAGLNLRFGRKATS